MKLIYLIFFLVIQLLSYSCQVKSQKIYVSSTLGNDNNSGLLKEFPVQTLKTAIRLGDTILLKSGDIFYESIEVEYCIIGKYGLSYVVIKESLAQNGNILEMTTYGK